MSSSVFQNNVAIITGASRGIGREMARQLAEQGAWLALAARNREQLQAVAQECVQRGARAIAIPTDVGEQVQCRNLIEQTVREFGKIDTLINNAGFGMWVKFEEIQDPAFFEQLARVNYLGSVYCTFYALPYLKQTRGRLVAVSSLAGKTGVPFRSGYAASKHALDGFFDSLRVVLMDSGVTITLAFPDFVATEIRAHNLGKDGKPLGVSPAREEKFMSAEECARLILRGAARREREIIMTTRGKWIGLVRLIAPALVDRMARRAIEQGH
jgi:short-subunit dehydrogenase